MVDMDDVTSNENREPDNTPAPQAGPAPRAAAAPAPGHEAQAAPGQQLPPATQPSEWATQTHAPQAPPTQTFPAYTDQPYPGQSPSAQSPAVHTGHAAAGQTYTGQQYAGHYAGQYSGQDAGQPYATAAGPHPGAASPYAPFAPTAARPVRTRRRRTGLAAIAVAGCLAAGTAGGALGVELAGNDNTVALRSAGSTSATQASIVDGTVQAAAATIIPSTVVISVSNNQGEGTGSGVILDTSGDILTNAHVVSGLSNASIEVTFSDGRTAPAEVVGVDASSDLAVISVSGVDNLTPAKFADSDALVIGQTVVAVGAPLGLSGTVTEGIVSAVDRPVRTGDSADASTVLDAVQTDASINPGNSGGPLVNLAGEVVGINSAIATVGASSGGEAGSIGVGFAIPSNDATNTADQLLADGTAEHASLGISASEPQTGTGALVRQVEPNSAAAEAGLAQGDLITELDDRQVVDLDSLLAAVRDHQPGDKVTVTVERDGSQQELTLTLGSREG